MSNHDDPAANRHFAMFDDKRLKHVLSLHDKSYVLLRWAKDSLERRTLSFNVAHQAMDSGASAEEWIRRHLENIPSTARPRAEDIASFSRLFASFVLTSFQLVENSVVVRSDCGCHCSFCSYLQAGPNLNLRNPSQKAKQVARELIAVY